jgi:GNAT superfamily N-acetyltransferase
MDEAAILRQLDIERQTVADSYGRLERTPYVVRAFGVGHRWAGILYSRFSHSETAAIVDAEIGYFIGLHCEFEWKVYSHDEPPDLLAQLRNRGFRIGDEEALLIREIREWSPFLIAPLPAGVTVNPVRDEQGIADFISVESAIWPCEASKTRELLLSIMGDPLQRDQAFVAYSDRKPAGCGRVTASQQSQFAGLWGGGVVPEFRGRGVYRALLSARIDHVRPFASIRYLRVDAMPTSRPILEKYGFKRVASTWPAEWPPVG